MPPNATTSDESEEKEANNYDVFLDCLSTWLLEKVAQQRPKERRRSKATKSSASRRKAGVRKGARNKNTEQTAYNTATGDTVLDGVEDDDIGDGADLAAATAEPPNNDAEELAEFIEYLATQTFPALPDELRTLDHYAWKDDADLATRYEGPLTGHETETILITLPASVSESLTAYGITNETVQGTYEFLAPVLSAYITRLSTAPPPPRTTKDLAEGCEICLRDWVGLSYHHLIPRMVHEKAVRRGWHRREELENVAWLCGACHRFVHRFKGHEELAREYFTVERLLEAREVREWATWVGRLRWKGGKVGGRRY